MMHIDVFQAGVYGEKQTSSRSAEGAEIRDRIFKVGGAAASWNLQPQGLC